MAFVGHVVIR